MKNTVLCLFILAIVSFMPGHTFAQIKVTPSLISSSGAYASSENFSVSWSLGEIAVTSLHGDHYILSQGFQQPLDFRVGIAPDEFEGNISVYPNPLRDELRIQFDLKRLEDIRLEIQDVTGRIVFQEAQRNLSSGDVVSLNVSEFPPGIYFLKVQSGDLKQLFVTSLTKL